MSKKDLKIRVRRKSRNKKITDKYSNILNYEYEKYGYHFQKDKNGEYRIENFKSKWDKLNDIYKESKK